MRALILVAALALGFGAVANELDGQQTISQKQIDLAKNLPKTLVVKVSRKNPSDVRVAHMAEEVVPGQNLENAKFEKVAMALETPDLNGKGEEMDTNSSTSSWRFYAGASIGYGRWNRQYNGNRWNNLRVNRFNRWNNFRNDGYVSTRRLDNWDNDCWDDCDYDYPRYTYSGYSYRYRPYFTSYDSDEDCDYIYYGWN